MIPSLTTTNHTLTEPPSFLIEECHAIASLQPSKFVRRRSLDELTTTDFQPFSITEDTQIHMYCSEAPCQSACSLSSIR